jgi:hypothetical protein
LRAHKKWPFQINRRGVIQGQFKRCLPKILGLLRLTSWRDGGMMYGFWFFIHYIMSWMNLISVDARKLSNHTSVAVKGFFEKEFILLHHLQMWHMFTACVLQFSEMVTSEVGYIGDDEQEIAARRQSFMKLFFLLLRQLFWHEFTPILWNYIYLNWNKQLFRYFKFFNFITSEVGNIALNHNFSYPLQNTNTI